MHRQCLTIISYLGHPRLKYTPVKCCGKLVKNHLTESPSLLEPACLWGRHMRRRRRGRWKEWKTVETRKQWKTVGSTVTQIIQKVTDTGSTFILAFKDQLIAEIFLPTIPVSHFPFPSLHFPPHWPRTEMFRVFPKGLTKLILTCEHVLPPSLLSVVLWHPRVQFCTLAPNFLNDINTSKQHNSRDISQQRCCSSAHTAASRRPSSNITVMLSFHSFSRQFSTSHPSSAVPL